MPDPTEVLPTDTTQPPVTDPFEAERAKVRQEVLAETQGIYQGAILDAERRANEARSELETLRRAPTAPPVSDPSSADFFADPMSHTRNLVRDELARAVAPLNQLALETRNASAYAQIKNQIRIDPRFAPHMASIEPLLDQEAQYLNEVTMNSVGTLAVNILGRIVIGAIPGFAPTVANTPTRQVPPVAVPPSAPTVPRTVPTAITLTEDQLKIARLWGMSPEQYLAYTNSEGSIDSLKGIK